MHKNRIQHIFLLLGCVYAFSMLGCVDEIRFNIDTDERKISLDGLLSDSLMTQTINLSYSSIIGVGNDNIQPPVEGAVVEIKDGEGNSFLFEEVSPGTYERFMAGEIGRSYQVEISLPDGNKIMSRPIIMQPSVPVDSLAYSIEAVAEINPSGNLVSANFMNVRAITRIRDGIRPFLRWRAQGVYEFREEYSGALNVRWCYVRENLDINNLVIGDTRGLANGFDFQEDILTKELDGKFFYQYALEILQYSMSEEEYTYWDNISSILNRDGSIFNPPPGTVRGNLFDPNDSDNEILGFFSVASVTFKRDIITPNNLGFSSIPKTCFSFRSAARQIQACSDCTVLSGSTQERPPYWD